MATTDELTETRNDDSCLHRIKSRAQTKTPCGHRKYLGKYRPQRGRSQNVRTQIVRLQVVRSFIVCSLVVQSYIVRSHVARSQIVRSVYRRYVHISCPRKDNSVFRTDKSCVVYHRGSCFHRIFDRVERRDDTRDDLVWKSKTPEMGVF